MARHGRALLVGGAVLGIGALGLAKWGSRAMGQRSRASLVGGFDRAIGRAQVWTPVTNAHLVCPLRLAKKTNPIPSTHRQRTSTRSHDTWHIRDTREETR